MMPKLIQLSALAASVAFVVSFSPSPSCHLARSSVLPRQSSSTQSALSAFPWRSDNENDIEKNLHRRFENSLANSFVTGCAALAILSSTIGGAAWADEWGKETEAPTFFTGETVMICKKRGPLGACLETTLRTAENDNDKASKYFRDPSEAVKRKQEQMRSSISEENEGNALIQKLRMQSEANKEKNEMEVRQKTLLNDQSASFGPFDRQVVILNTDGKTFTLLQNPQAMRLKKAGYIEDRKFVIQPSKEVIDEALEGKNDLGQAIMGFFGGGGGSDGGVEATPVNDDSVGDVEVVNGDVSASVE